MSNWTIATFLYLPIVFFSNLKICMNILPACMSILWKHALCLHMLEDGVRSSGTGVLGCYKPQCGC